jgi:hypothetical protein
MWTEDSCVGGRIGQRPTSEMLRVSPPPCSPNLETPQKYGTKWKKPCILKMGEFSYASRKFKQWRWPQGGRPLGRGPQCSRRSPGKHRPLAELDVRLLLLPQRRVLSYLCFSFSFTSESNYVAQTGLKLMSSSNPPTSASWVAGTTGVCALYLLFFFFKLQLAWNPSGEVIRAYCTGKWGHAVPTLCSLRLHLSLHWDRIWQLPTLSAAPE